MVTSSLRLCFFIFSHFFLTASITKADDPLYLSHSCSTNKNFTLNSVYKVSLNTLLSSLSSHAIGSTQFYNTTTGGGISGDAVYGLFMCRGDVTDQMCRECVAIATQQIASRCPHSKEAIIWYHECLIRYSNRSFFSTMDEWPRIRLGNYNVTTNLSNQGSFSWVLANTLNEVVAEVANAGPAGTKKFATKRANFTGNGTVYTLAQCTPDLSRQDCGKCLSDMMGDIRLCCLGKDGGMVLYPSCNLMFGLHRYYRDVVVNQQPTHPSPFPTGESAPTGDKHKKSRTIAILVGLFVVSAVLSCFGCYVEKRKARKSYKLLLRENFGNECTTLESLQFDFATIEAATNKFSPENWIGKGGFGEVYKGILPDGREVAVKRLSTSSGQGVLEFKNEVLLIAKLQHRNLVTLLGFCLEEQEKILVYEFVPNKSLDYFLFDSQKQRILDWSKRCKIIGGIARAILYLHEHSRLKVIHRDLKPSNILLDRNMNPKLSDFGMARMIDIDQDQGRTNRIVGTYGYMSPEYAMFGKYSEKSDIFSFGVMVLEIISGRRNASPHESYDVDSLLNYAWKHWKDGNALQILDPELRESHSEIEVIKCIQTGLLCVQENPGDRPQMATVVLYLSNFSAELPFPSEPAFFISGRMGPNLVAMELSSGRATNNSGTASINQVSITRSFPR